MNAYEYEFMTGRWKGPRGAAYNTVYEFCKNSGWIMGWSDHDEPIPTQAGSEAIERYLNK